MKQIDIDKFVCSLFEIIGNTSYKIRMSNIIDALRHQGLEYKDGAIQSIPLTEEQKSYIDEGLKNGSMARESDLLHPDDWYECTHSFLDEYGYPSFVIGEFANLGKILEMGVKEEQVKDYFKPCTECTKLSFPIDSQVFSKSLQIIGTVVKTYKEGCVVKEIGLHQFHNYNDLEQLSSLKNTDTTKFAKKIDIDAMVERFKEGIILSKNLKHDDLMVRAIAYRKGLEDMYIKLKEELI